MSQKVEKQTFVASLMSSVSACAPRRLSSQFSTLNLFSMEHSILKMAFFVVSTGVGSAWGQCEADVTVYLSDYTFHAQPIDHIRRSDGCLRECRRHAQR